MKKTVGIFCILSIIIVSATLFLAPLPAYADNVGCSVWVETTGPTGSPAIWDIWIEPTTWGSASGLTYVITLSEQVLGEIYNTSGTVPTDNWYGAKFMVSSLSAGNYQAKLEIKDGDTPVAQSTYDFSLWEHSQGINIESQGKSITWYATNSSGKWANFGLSRYSPDYANIDDLWVYITSDNWAYARNYSLTPGGYTAFLWINGYDGRQDFTVSAGGGTTAVAEKPWVRDHPMTCYQVWVNKDNNFEMVFWWPYRDNNWVKIYDTNGKMVYEVDMPCDNPHIVVDLPDGMYTVKTFNDQPGPLQEFVIGKP